MHAARLNRASSKVNRVSASVLIGLKRCRHLMGLFSMDMGHGRNPKASLLVIHVVSTGLSTAAQLSSTVPVSVSVSSTAGCDTQGCVSISIPSWCLVSAHVICATVPEQGRDITGHTNCGMSTCFPDKNWYLPFPNDHLLLSFIIFYLRWRNFSD